MLKLILVLVSSYVFNVYRESSIVNIYSMWVHINEYSSHDLLCICPISDAPHMYVCACSNVANCNRTSSLHILSLKAYLEVILALHFSVYIFAAVLLEQSLSSMIQQ